MDSSQVLWVDCVSSWISVCLFVLYSIVWVMFRIIVGLGSDPVPPPGLVVLQYRLHFASLLFSLPSFLVCETCQAH